MPHYICNWIENPYFTFIGTETNPKTGMVYDYWLHSKDGEKSFCARHGEKPHEYGSTNIKYFISTKESLEKIFEDYMFGIVRAQYFVLVYLTTNERPLCQHQ